MHTNETIRGDQRVFFEVANCGVVGWWLCGGGGCGGGVVLWDDGGVVG